MYDINKIIGQVNEIYVEAKRLEIPTRCMIVHPVWCDEQKDKPTVNFQALTSEWETVALPLFNKINELIKRSNELRKGLSPQDAIKLGYESIGNISQFIKKLKAYQKSFIKEAELDMIQRIDRWLKTDGSPKAINKCFDCLFDGKCDVLGDGKLIKTDKK